MGTTAGPVVCRDCDGAGHVWWLWAVGWNNLKGGW